MERRPRILLGVTGSVAAVKLPALALALDAFADVKVVMTGAASRFMAPAAAYDAANYDAFSTHAPPIPVLRDADEWSSYRTVRDDTVLHIELRKWADLLVIAPLSANSLAKLSQGISDNLLTCIARAWDFKSNKPFLVAPAMNTAMWDHPVTAEQLQTLRLWGVTIVPPIVSTLACGDTGTGALAKVEEIVAAIKAALGDSSGFIF